MFINFVKESTKAIECNPRRTLIIGNVNPNGSHMVEDVVATNGTKYARV